MLYFIFFLSGAAALTFEVLWFRLAGLVLGNTVWAATLVLAGFMAGLALGSALTIKRAERLRHPLFVYAVLESLVGMSGVVLVLWLPQLPAQLAPLFTALGDLPTLVQILRLGLAFVLFALPATAMGMTLPLLVQALAPAQGYGVALGRLYGWNTLGAVTGVLLAELLFIRTLGLYQTGVIAALLSIGAALLALLYACLLGFLHRRDRPAEFPVVAASAVRPELRLLLAAALAGALLLALEVIWFRFTLLYMRGTSLVFAVMLALVLGGIGAGGLLGGGWLRREPKAAHKAAAVAVAAGGTTLVGYALLHPFWLAALGQAGEGWRLGALGLVLMLPTALLSGALFTLLGDRLEVQMNQPLRSTGWLTLANTTGAALGAALAGLWWLPRFGMESTLCALALGYLLVALILSLGTSPRLWLAALLVLAGGLLLSHLNLMTAHLDAATQPFRERDESRTVMVREGLNETLQLLQRDQWGVPMAYRLVSNGSSMSGTENDSLRYMKLFAWWPLAVHPRVESSLLISYGLGSTAQALVAAREVREIDVVDTSAATLAMTDGLYRDSGRNPLRDPRVRVHIEDGRHFLLTTPRRYDLITGEPPPPRLDGVVSLYTQEYFELLRARLNPGGVVTYWLPVDQLDMQSARSILRGFCNAYADCSLWAGSNYNWLMIGSNDMRGPVEPAVFTRQWADSVAVAELSALGFERPEQLGATFIADAAQIEHWLGRSMPLIDDFPQRLHDTGPSEPELMEYSRWMDDLQAEKRFQDSGQIAAWWPAALREATLPYFALQPLVNNQLRVSQAEAFAVADSLLTQTRLHTPVLWLLGSSVQEQRLLDQLLAAQSYRAEFGYALGVRAVLAGDFSIAADFFLDALMVEPRRGMLPAYYCLCRSGRIAAAQALVQDYPELHVLADDIACEVPELLTE
jgi:spermidine synthase